MELINLNKKYPQVAYLGFLFNFHKECSNFICWRCSKNSSMKCLCFLKTSLNINNPIFISVNNDYVHQGNENFISATKIKNAIVEKAKLTSNSLCIMYLYIIDFDYCSHK
ncbi:FLYWCH-type domain-containing protein [Aphis craccivora]|uniref:FLYWCH-type domain-containing protein n=1 Tax=Aphis craccivora TaxID=307492 RepID=A0A6G0VZU1_APHCR|nr:FLYWCH-type domain-containing protein [Aphis craccivora]